MKNLLRTFLWRILGFDYRRIQRNNDYVYLKDDLYTTFGTRTYENGALIWRWSNAPVSIGNYCSIANNVRFIVDDGFHNVSKITNFPLINNLFNESEKLPNGLKTKEYLKQLDQKKGIIIGNDVWIGMNSILLPGIKIGNGVTIGANSIVTKSFPDYCVIAGNPAKIIKYKYPKSQIAVLNQICWWDWSDETIKERIMDFHESIDSFVEKYG